jgi:UDP-glucose 6-dehydrogenase
MARHLSSCGAKVFAHDPVAGPNAVKALGPDVIEFVEDWKAVITKADGIIVATRWNDYAELAEAAPQLAGKVLLDARRMFHADQFPGARLVAVGFVPAGIHTSLEMDRS